MSEEKFTQGPWIAFYKRKYDEWHVSIPDGDNNGFNIALFPDGIDTDHPKEDACLIAAAPEMYQMLDKLAVGAKELLTKDTYQEMERILKKARGEE